MLFSVKPKAGRTSFIGELTCLRAASTASHHVGRVRSTSAGFDAIDVQRLPKACLTSKFAKVPDGAQQAE
jgi:hypothetical protein